MPNKTTDQVTTLSVFYKAILPLVFTWLLIFLSLLIPLLDSTRPPFFDLSQAVATVAYWLSESGGKFGVSLLAVLVLLLLVTRPQLTSRQRWREAGVLVLLAVVFAGGGAFLNEHFLKERLQLPRPNISWLAGEDGAGPLGLSAAAFYQLGDKSVRSEKLRQVLQSVPPVILLSPAIEKHWIAETGYSFPSGHAFSAMFFASLFLTVAVSCITTARICFFYALLPWALLVCYSRSVLMLHTPLDIIAGGLQGLLVGLVAWLFSRWLLVRAG